MQLIHRHRSVFSAGDQVRQEVQGSLNVLGLCVITDTPVAGGRDAQTLSGIILRTPENGQDVQLHIRQLLILLGAAQIEHSLAAAEVLQAVCGGFLCQFRGVTGGVVDVQIQKCLEITGDGCQIRGHIAGQIRTGKGGEAQGFLIGVDGAGFLPQFCQAGNLGQGVTGPGQKLGVHNQAEGINVVGDAADLLVIPEGQIPGSQLVVHGGAGEIQAQILPLVQLCFAVEGEQGGRFLPCLAGRNYRYGDVGGLGVIGGDFFPGSLKAGVIIQNPDMGLGRRRRLRGGLGGCGGGGLRLKMRLRNRQVIQQQAEAQHANPEQCKDPFRHVVTLL